MNDSDSSFAVHEAGANEQNPGIMRLLESSRSIAGAGIGAAIGLILGPSAGPVVGAALGETFNQIATEFANRHHSAREEARVGTVIREASAAIVLLQVKGMSVRDDGFFQSDWADGDEIVEGVLTTAKSTYEERKLRYLGNMLARIACVDTIDRHTANHMIQNAERLSWLHLLLLSLVDQIERYPLPTVELEATRRDWGHWTPVRALLELRDDIHMLNYSYFPTSADGAPKMDLRMSSLVLTSGGNLMAASMELATIPESELKPIYEKLIGAENRDN